MAAPEPSPWLRRAQILISVLAGLVGAAGGVAATAWHNAEEREAFKAQARLDHARLERLVTDYLEMRKDVSELKGRNR